MIEFLEHISTVESEVGREAAAFRSLISEREDGKRTRAITRGPKHQRVLLEVARLMDRAVKGDSRAHFLLKEAMTTSDFPLYMGSVIDRAMLGRYQETQPIWPNIAARKTVRDFRTQDEYAIDGAEAVLAQVDQQAEYPETALSETRYQWKVQKYGRRIPYSFEAYINDDLDMLSSIPDRLARAARRSEEKFVTQLYIDANGPHASFYTSGNKNIINATNAGAGFTAVNPALTIAGLQQGFAVLGNLRDADGEPITVESVELIVPPALEVTANNILNATELWITTDAAFPSGGVAGQQLHVANWIKNRLRLSVNPYLPIVASSANGNTSWLMFASTSTGRPALRFGFLRGYEEPAIYIKTPNQTRVGGGASSAFEGDFNTDSIEQKIRHLFGGTRLDPKSTVASNGSGS